MPSHAPTNIEIPGGHPVRALGRSPRPTPWSIQAPAARDVLVASGEDRVASPPKQGSAAPDAGGAKKKTAAQKEPAAKKKRST